MKILHYVNESTLTWAVPFTQVLRSLEQLGAKNSVLCAPGGTLSGMLEQMNIPWRTQKAFFPWYPFACANIGYTIAKERPDVIVTRLSSASFIGGYWGKKLGIPVVGVLDKFAKKKYYRYVDAVQVVSSPLLEYANNAEFPHSVLVPNGISTSLYAEVPGFRRTTRERLGIGAEDIVITAAGRFVDGKGFVVLLLAFSELLKLFANKKKLFLLLVGDGEERSRLENLSAEQNLKGHVLFPGFVSDIRPFLQASDFFVLPSKESESFGLVLLEAMASGLPAIATDVGGPRDMIDDGVSGWIIPPNDVDSLTNALKRALEHTELRSISHRALEAAQRFDLNLVARESYELYRRCASTFQ